VTCQLSIKQSGKWVTVKTDADYREAEAFALKESGVFVVKMTGQDEQGNDKTGYFTNCPETCGHYQAKGLNCYMVGG
jgi:hypothetical protein